MKHSPLLCLLLGAWLGGSLLVVTAVTYNFSGFPHMFARNPELAKRAGFAAEDEDARKESLLWVHASELNRVAFEVWGRVQIGLGAACLVVAAVRRQRILVIASLALATGLTAYLTLKLTPEIVELGRAIDFVPRKPPPPELEAFGARHGLFSIVHLICLAALLLATLGALGWLPRRRGTLSTPTASSSDA